MPGLPDEAFIHDGMMTKREIRSTTLCRLMPARGEVLWDIGCGAGSIAIEWMRCARDARAVGIDLNSNRLAMARRNAQALGAPQLTLIEGRAPEALDTIPAPEGTKVDLRHPNAIFIGGGLSDAVVKNCLASLARGGRLVANTVTLESEALLLALHSRHGGDLTRLSVARAAPVGGRTAWRPMMPVMQWALTR